MPIHVYFVKINPMFNQPSHHESTEEFALPGVGTLMMVWGEIFPTKIDVKKTLWEFPQEELVLEGLLSICL